MEIALRQATLIRENFCPQHADKPMPDRWPSRLNAKIDYFRIALELIPFTCTEMIEYHKTANGISVAEILPGSDTIGTTGDMLDILADAGYNGSTGMIVHSATLSRDFFDLKTGLAGDILQKFSNYRMRLAIIGDFTEVKSKALRDFIRESNTRRTINFVNSLEEALERMKNM